AQLLLRARFRLHAMDRVASERSVPKPVTSRQAGESCGRPTGSSWRYFVHPGRPVMIDRILASKGLVAYRTPSRSSLPFRDLEDHRIRPGERLVCVRPDFVLPGGIMRRSLRYVTGTLARWAAISTALSALLFVA